MHWIRRFWLLIVLVLIFILLQYKLWFSHGGIEQTQAIKKQIKQQQATVDKAQARNDALMKEVEHIQGNQEAVEAHARYDLGMVKPDEEYIQIVPPAKKEKKTNEDSTQ